MSNNKVCIGIAIIIYHQKTNLNTCIVCLLPCFKMAADCFKMVTEVVKSFSFIRATQLVLHISDSLTKNSYEVSKTV